MRPIHVAFALALSVAACAPPAPPPSTPPPEIITGSSEIAPDALAAANMGLLAGTYRSGADTLLIARAGNQLTVDLPGPLGPQPLKLVGLGAFADAAGAAYLFSAPQDGSGLLLTIHSVAGAVRVWRRFP